MAPVIAYTLPTMQLVCNLVYSDGPNWKTDTDSTTNQSTSQGNFPPVPEGYVEHPDIGTAYKIYNESVTWKQAREGCLKEGAHLAVTDTYVKFETLMSQVPLINMIHVGINRMYDDTEWVSTTTGASLTNIAWAPTYPTGVYDCLMAGYAPRGLKNLACTTKAIYVCERPIRQSSKGQKDQMGEIGLN